MQAGKLEQGLRGFRATVAEKNLAGTRIITKPSCLFTLQRTCEEVAAMTQLLDLVLHGLDPYGMAVPKRIHRHSAGKVQIFTTLVIPDPGALSAHNGNWGRGIIAQYKLLVQFLCFRFHSKIIS